MQKEKPTILNIAGFSFCIVNNYRFNILKSSRNKKYLLIKSTVT